MICRLVMAPLCSFSEATIDCVDLPMFHTRTTPLPPPDSRREQSFEHTSAVTPCACASLMVKSSVPDCGRKARMRPSDQPEMMALPSAVKHVHRHSRLGTWMRSSSLRVRACHTRMSCCEHVANSSE